MEDGGPDDIRPLHTAIPQYPIPTLPMVSVLTCPSTTVKRVVLKAHQRVDPRCEGGLVDQRKARVREVLEGQDKALFLCLGNIQER